MISANIEFVLKISFSSTSKEMKNIMLTNTAYHEAASTLSMLQFWSFLCSQLLDFTAHFDCKPRVKTIYNLWKLSQFKKKDYYYEKRNSNVKENPGRQLPY